MQTLPLLIFITVYYNGITIKYCMYYVRLDFCTVSVSYVKRYALFFMDEFCHTAV